MRAMSQLPCPRSHLPCPSFYLPEYTSHSDWLHHNNLIYIVILNYILSSEQQNRRLRVGGRSAGITSSIGRGLRVCGRSAGVAVQTGRRARRAGSGKCACAGMKPLHPALLARCNVPVGPGGLKVPCQSGRVG